MAIVNPTNLTPPRVDFLDPRTGAISREWYRFFLSLLTATETNQSEIELAPDANALLASYDAMLADLTQITESAPDCCSEIASVDAKVDSLTQGLALAPRAELGTLSAIQQDDVPWLIFHPNPVPVPVDVGSVYWDGGTTLNLQMTPNVIQKIGEDQYFYIKASGAITKGQLIMFTGAVGASGVVTGAPATGVTDGQYLIGVAAENIALNGFGLIQDFGPLRNVNTSGYADGDILYYDSATPGGMTNVLPSAPNVKATIAVVTKGGSVGGGSIFIRMSTGSVLGGTDSNVQFTALSDDDIISYNSTLGYWQNVPASSVQVLSWLGL